MAKAGGETQTTLPRDAVLDELCRQPFRLFRPLMQSVPFVFASPHSGRAYPPSFVAQSRLSFRNLRRSEDAFVDELFASVLHCGAPFIAASFPRAYLDANRAPAELDAGMFEGPLPFAVDAASPRVNAGLGVIPRIVREGAEIYRDKLATQEAGERLTRLYRPYHAALAQLVEETHARFGVVAVIDCHSMPSATAAPDIVLGDRYGVSAATAVIRAAEGAFERHGFSVARNVPYSGGYTTQLHGRPGRARHALQIEINRALYLDEETIQRRPQFAELTERLAAALRALASFDLAALDPHRPVPRHAAE
jgi:N-formylglutamate deformylase